MNYKNIILFTLIALLSGYASIAQAMEPEQITTSDHRELNKILLLTTYEQFQCAH